MWVRIPPRAREQVDCPVEELWLLRGSMNVPSTSSQVVVFWRPGCPFCYRLRSYLHRVGVEVSEVNIWADPEGAAYVRSITGGDETVPTVRIGERAMVNPSPKRLLQDIRKAYPELVGPEPAKTHRLGALGLFRRGR